jgi:hypothetical protein
MKLSSDLLNSSSDPIAGEYFVGRQKKPAEAG